jgi:hypothetical protein
MRRLTRAVGDSQRLGAGHAAWSRRIRSETVGAIDDQAGFRLGSDAHPGTKAEPSLVRICPSRSVAWGVVRQRHW